MSTSLATRLMPSLPPPGDDDLCPESASDPGARISGIIERSAPLELIGTTVGSYAGWYLGSLLGGGFMTSFILSMVGLGVGMYYGAKKAKDYE